MSAATVQRFTKTHPCPICGGYEQAPRGQGERCFGFVSSDGAYAHCTREEHAGALPLEASGQTYAHKLHGACRCGAEHGPAQPAPRRAVKKTSDQQWAIVAEYPYERPDGKLLYQVLRKEPVPRTGEKRFVQRMPAPDGHWAWGLKAGIYEQGQDGDWRPVEKGSQGATGNRKLQHFEGRSGSLYLLPELRALPRLARVYVVEGEKDVDRARAAGLSATCNSGGAGKWPPLSGQYLHGLDVVVIPDNDKPGLAHGRAVAREVREHAASVKVLMLPGLPEHGDLSDWLDAGHTVEELEQLADDAPLWNPDAPDEPAEPVEPKTLQEVHEAYARWLYLPTTDALDVVLGAYAANRGKGTPLWLLYVGPPGAGKTEKLSSIIGLGDVQAVGTLTMASLLSGTPARDRSKSAKGGLLPQIGERGVLVLPDFGSILAMNRDARQEVLQGLRQAYDGYVIRHVGSDGGQKMEWRGKLGLIGGATPAVDEHHAVMGALGERFLFFRESAMSVGEEKALTSRALDLPGDEEQMRTELRAVVAGLISTLPETPEQAPLSNDERDWLIGLARFAVRGRAPVTREPTGARAIENIRGAEAPTRMAIGLRQLFSGLVAIGVGRARAWYLVRKVALDSMPQLRQAALAVLAGATAPVETSTVAQSLWHPTTTVHRVLEELAAYQLVRRTKQGEGKADLWALTDYAAEAWQALEATPAPVVVVGTSPEMSDDTLSAATGGERRENTPHTALSDISGEVMDGASTNGATHAPKTNGRYHPKEGDWIHPLTADGTLLPPERVERLEQAPDGAWWLYVVGSKTGWPADQCEPAEAPPATAEAPPPACPDCGGPLSALQPVPGQRGTRGAWCDRCGRTVWQQ